MVQCCDSFNFTMTRHHAARLLLLVATATPATTTLPPATTTTDCPAGAHPLLPRCTDATSTGITNNDGTDVSCAQLATMGYCSFYDLDYRAYVIKKCPQACGVCDPHFNDGWCVCEGGAFCAGGEEGGCNPTEPRDLWQPVKVRPVFR
jgi:hypothetical protein